MEPSYVELSAEEIRQYVEYCRLAVTNPLIPWMTSRTWRNRDMAFQRQEFVRDPSSGRAVLVGFSRDGIRVGFVFGNDEELAIGKIIVPVMEYRAAQDMLDIPVSHQHQPAYFAVELLRRQLNDLDGIELEGCGLPGIMK